MAQGRRVKERLTRCAKLSPGRAREALGWPAIRALTCCWTLAGYLPASRRDRRRGVALMFPRRHMSVPRGASLVVATWHHAAASTVPRGDLFRALPNFQCQRRPIVRLRESRERFGRANTQTPGRDNRARRRLPGTSHARPGASHMAQELMEFLQRQLCRGSGASWGADRRPGQQGPGSRAGADLQQRGLALLHR